MQTGALDSLAKQTQQSIASITQSTNAALAGQVQANQQIMNLDQQRAQAYVAEDNKPNTLVQLANAGVAAYTGWQQQQQQQKLKLQQQKQQMQDDVDYARTQSQLTNLHANYEANNWENGTVGFQNDAAAILSTYQPKNPTQAENFKNMMLYAADAVDSRNKTVGANLQQAQLQAKQQNIALQTANLQSSLVPLYSQITNAPDDTTKKQYSDAAYKGLQASIGQMKASGMSDSDIVAATLPILNTITERSQANQDANTKYQANVDLNTANYIKGAQAFNQAELQYNSKKISYAQKVAIQNELPLQYPGFTTGSQAQTGDEESKKLAVAQTTQTFKDLNQRMGNQALAQTQFTDAETKAVAANLYLHPEQIAIYSNTPGLKDNPAVIKAISLAQNRIAYDTDGDKVALDQQRTITSIAQLDLTKADTYIQFSKSFIKPPEQLSTTEQIQRAAAQKILGSDFDKAQQLAQQAPNDPNAKAELQSLLSYKDRAISNVQQSMKAENAQQTKAFYDKYQDLHSTGLDVPRDQLIQYAKSTVPLMNGLNQRLQKLQLESTQQINQPYGVQPNFKGSGSQAEDDSDDDTPAQPPIQTQRILYKGKQIVTPVSVGMQSTKVTGPWAEQRAAGQYGNPVAHKHAGVDFAESLGAKNIAMVAGKVVYIGSNPGGYGGFIDIMGNNGMLYRYAHQKPLVPVGANVSAGQVVSAADGSGDGTGPHLLFEVRQPQLNNKGEYDPSLNYGFQNTIDPIGHLASLQNAGYSNVPQPRGATTFGSIYPTKKANGNSTLLSNGVINAGMYQEPSEVDPTPVHNRFTSQRPINTGSIPAWVKVGQFPVNLDNDWGYSALRSNPELRRQINKTADNLGVPGAWVADIMNQESGFNPNARTSTGNVGLWGIGRDSMNDINNYNRVASGKASPAEQVRQYEQYMKENGWFEVARRKSEQVSIADLWAMSRMGTIPRQRFLKSGDININLSDYNHPFSAELQQLGRTAGRRYDFGGGNSRRSRNSAMGNSNMYLGSLPSQLSESGSIAPMLAAG